jgi:hypothetical protein
MLRLNHKLPQLLLNFTLVFFAQRLKTPNRCAGEFGVFHAFLCLKTGAMVSYLKNIF